MAYLLWNARFIDDSEACWWRRFVLDSRIRPGLGRGTLFTGVRDDGELLGLHG